LLFSKPDRQRQLLLGLLLQVPVQQEGQQQQVRVPGIQPGTRKEMYYFC